MARLATISYDNVVVQTLATAVSQYSSAGSGVRKVGTRSVPILNIRLLELKRKLPAL